MEKKKRKYSIYRYIHIVVGIILSIVFTVQTIVTLANPKYSSEVSLIATIVPFCVLLWVEVVIGFIDLKKRNKVLKILHVIVIPILIVLFLVLHIVFAALIKRGMM